MKLTSRLIIVLTFFISLATFSAGTFSIYANREQQINNYKQSLNAIYLEMKQSKDEPVSLALLLANKSLIPMSLAFISDNNEITYLVDNAGTELQSVNKDLVDGGDKSTIAENKKLIRFYKIGNGEAVAFIVSTALIDAQISETWRKILLFNFGLIFCCVILVLLVFRRDSKLNTAAKSMQEFIGDASHELKTPLTVIRGYSEMLVNSSENVETYAKKINVESLRMSRIIDQLLRIAALNEREIEQSEAIDIAQYLQSQIENIRVLQPERVINFNSAPLVIKAPFEIVEILLSNVLTNARLHSPVTVPINIAIKDKKVTIEDGGPGMPNIPDKPFKRFDSSRSRETGGSGLGMSLIQKSAKEIGAKLQFSKSELGGLKVEISF